MFHRYFRPNLQTKIIAWSFIPTAFILFLVGVILYIAYQQVTEAFAIDRDADLTSLSAEELSGGFEDYVDRLWVISRFQALQSGRPEEIQAVLEEQQMRLIFFDAGVYILDNRGEVLAVLSERQDWIGQDWSSRTYFRNLIRSNQPYFSNILPDGPNGDAVVVLSVPILGENEEFKGVVSGMFALNSSAVSPFFGKILKTRIGQTNNAYIVDGKGHIIYEPNFERIGEDFSFHPMHQQALSKQLGALRMKMDDRRDIVVSYAPVPRTEWSLVSEENWEDLARPSQTFRVSLLFLMFLGLALPSLVVMIGMRRITGPLNEFIAAAQKIAGGDFDQTISVETHDELETLALQFNRMASELKHSYALLETRVEERTKELTAVNSIAALVSRSLEMEAVLPDTLDRIIQVMEMDGGLIHSLDDEQGGMNLLVHQGLGEEELNQGAFALVDSNFVAEVIETRQPVVRQVSQYPPGPVRARLEAQGIRLVVSIPLVSQDRVFGAINVFSERETNPSREIMAVASAIGQQIGLAMQNATLYTQTLAYAHEAEEANKAKSAFLANMSHELRTPLNAIIGFTRIVRRKGSDVLPERQLENLDKVRISADHLLGLINQVLDLSKIEAGRIDVFATTFDPRIMIEICLETIKPLLKPGVSLVSDITKAPANIYTDSDKFKQILLNLLGNAVKFTDSGEIRLAVEMQATDIIIAVSDTGIGIPPEQVDRVFEQFQQLDDSTTRKYGGTGLGLSISRELARLLGGDLTAESEVGVGSTFRLCLPVRYVMPELLVMQEGAKEPEL